MQAGTFLAQRPSAQAKFFIRSSVGVLAKHSDDQLSLRVHDLQTGKPITQ